MDDKGVRRLTALEQSASSARVLNLMSIHRKFPNDSELTAKPFFTNRTLNRCIVLKHRLRPHEYGAFSSHVPTATKILVPIDSTDLRSGAHSFFVGQIGFDDLAEANFGEDLRPGTRDRQILDLMALLPSLDPFLLREHLRGHDIEPARLYFNISDADTQRMVEFAREEILALVVLSTGSEKGAQTASIRLVDKLLSNSPDGGFEPLKITLNLSDEEYMNGVFSWRGFIYYKWVMSDLSIALDEVLMEIAQIQGRGVKSLDTGMYIVSAKARIRSALIRFRKNVQSLLDVYNNAYRMLTGECKPAAFRDFLISAPAMFSQIGEQLGGIQHVVSFWRYRMPKNKPRIITFDELEDLFQDFESGLASE